MAVEAHPESPRRARTRERLLDAAFEVFAEHGFAASSVEQIAEHAGFTRGAFYSNFSTKEELFMALVDRGREQWLAEVSTRVPQMLPESESPHLISEDQIGAIIAASLAGPFDHRRRSMIMAEFRLLAMRDESLARAYVQDRESLETSVSPILADAVHRSGRRLHLDARNAVRLAIAVYQDTLETTALGVQDDAEATAIIQVALTRVMMAITEPA